MNNKFYFYKNHHSGGWYCETKKYNDDELYCEACEDWDSILNDTPMTLEEFKKHFPEIFIKGEDNS